MREWLEEGHKVGLGTDVAGGYSPSMLNAIRLARVASVATYVPVGGGTGRQVGAHQFASGRTLSYNEIFFLATMGGAQVMGLEQTIGNFELGKAFDALIVDCALTSEGGSPRGNNIEIYLHDTVEDRKYPQVPLAVKARQERSTLWITLWFCLTLACTTAWQIFPSF